MKVEITPRWKPLGFTATEHPLFEPVLVHERGLLVTGAPDALHVFAIGNRPFEWFAVQAKSWITGFTVSASSLYVQDGPVLISHDLTLGKPFHALNLVTGERWTLDDGTAEPPESLYQLTGDKAPLQAQLLAQRKTHAPALEEAPDAAPSQALLAARLDARGIDFSAPVVRRFQIDGRRSNQVFSLCMDGQVLAMDDALEEAQVFAGEAPLRAELVMAELPQPSGQVLCHLYYVSATGSIVAIDATGDMAPLPGWPAKGLVAAERVLPLRHVDGLLMGGGILGNDFFATGLNPAKPPLFTVPGPDGGWRQYDIAPLEKLVVLSDGLSSRLVCYQADAGTRDRWQLRQSPGGPAFSLFWTDTGAGAAVPGPKLVIEADKAPPEAGSLPGLRFVMANTVDAIANVVFVDYPPPSHTLSAVTLGRGLPPVQLPPVALMTCRPAVAQQTLYCVLRTAAAGEPASKYTVAAFAIGTILPPLLQAAQAKLDELKRIALRSRVHVTRSITTYHMLSQEQETEGPIDLANSAVTLQPPGGPPITVTTDGNGMVVMDGQYAGQHMNVDSRSWLGESAGVKLVPNAVNELHFQASKYVRL